MCFSEYHVVVMSVVDTPMLTSLKQDGESLSESIENELQKKAASTAIEMVSVALCSVDRIRDVIHFA